MTGLWIEGNEGPEWLLELRSKPKDRYHSVAGNAWIRFHKWGFMRFPPHNIDRIEKSEERELFLRARAWLISYHHIPSENENANSVLYLCRDKSYDISKLSANNRSKVRRGFKHLTVRRAQTSEIAEKGYECYRDTCRRNGVGAISKKAYQTKWRDRRPPANREQWAVFAGDEIAALGTVWICGNWAELFSTQSSDLYLRSYSNHVLFYTILHDLLHRSDIESVSYGLSSVQPNSKLDSLHRFKLSLNFEAIPVVREIKINPILRPVLNKLTLRCARLLETFFPSSRHVLAARGALELVSRANLSTSKIGI